MDINEIEITLLSEEEIWGVNGGRQLDVLDKYGTIAAITDLVVLTGGYCEDTQIYTAPDDNSLKGRTSWFYTRSYCGDGEVRGVDEDGSRYWDNRFKRSGAVRPVLLSSSVFSQISPNRVRGYNGTEEVEYGEYPQYAPDSDMQRRLESEYQRGNLRTTGRDYTFDRTKFNDYEQPFQPVKYEEYEYQGRRYIRVQARSDYKGKEFKLSNGVKYRDGDNVWVEVSPVVWLIDDGTKTLVSKRGILSGIRFYDSKEKYDGDFSKTEMKEFLVKYMLRDMFQSCKNIKIKEDVAASIVQSNEKSEKINAIIDEIYKFLDSYYGKENYKEKVDILIDKYNENINKCYNNNGLVLTNVSMNPRVLYLRLVDDLEDILSKLKLFNEKYKEHSEMLRLVRRCIKMLKEGSDNEPQDDLEQDIFTIKKVILPFLNDKNKNNELLNIFLEEEKNIMDYLKGKEDNSIKKCQTFDEFKLRVRRKIHPFLLGLGSDVRNKDLVHKIQEGYINICEGNFQNDRHDYIDNLLNEIQKNIDEIRDNGNKEEIAKLTEIIAKRITFDENNLIEAIEKIAKIYVKIYGIVLDIRDRNLYEQELENYKIKVGKRG